MCSPCPLNSLSDQNGHSTSALWTLIRIEGYIASLASRIVQFDIQKMALSLLQAESARDLHESALSIAVLSWNSSGRQQLLENRWAHLTLSVAHDSLAPA